MMKTFAVALASSLWVAACTQQPTADEIYDIAEVATADCSEVDESIDEKEREPDLTLVLDVVAMPASPKHPALQTSNSDGGLWEGIKWGISIRNEAPTFSVSVPDDFRDRVFVHNWGTGTETNAWEVVFPSCERTDVWVSDWLIFGGGVTVREPECVPLIVASGDRFETVLIGVGTPCEGQDPPPEPTVTTP